MKFLAKTKSNDDIHFGFCFEAKLVAKPFAKLLTEEFAWAWRFEA